MRSALHTRGAATVELAVLMPLAVLFLTAGQWATELLAVKLKLREAARFQAWETASYPQTDYATGESVRRSNDVLAGARARAEGRYVDLDSAREALAPAGLLSRATDVTFQLRSTPLQWSAAEGRLTPDAGGRAALAAALVRANPLELPRRWGFTNPVAVVASVSTSARLPRLGIALFPDRAGAAPERLTLEATVAVVTDSGAMFDGEDSTVGADRTGIHPDGHRSALYLQVRRMRFLGHPEWFEPEQRVAATLTALLPFAPPEFTGAFVVDHALGLDVRRACDGTPGYPREASSGLRDFADQVEPGSPVCFGTQPLRDTQEYEASSQLHALRARGPYFLGCPHPGADDPSRAVDADLTDANVLKESCGGGR